MVATNRVRLSVKIQKIGGGGGGGVRFITASDLVFKTVDVHLVREETVSQATIVHNVYRLFIDGLFTSVEGIRLSV